MQFKSFECSLKVCIRCFLAVGGSLVVYLSFDLSRFKLELHSTIIMTFEPWPLLYHMKIGCLEML